MKQLIQSMFFSTALFVAAGALPTVAGADAVRLSVPLRVAETDGVQVRLGRLRLYPQAFVADDKSPHVSIEAERYENALWKAANTDTMVSETWIEQVEARGTENLLERDGASGGKVLVRAERLTYPVMVKRKRGMVVWVRLRKKAGWIGIQFDNSKVYPRMVGRRKDRIVEDKDGWFWQNLGYFGLHEGVNLVHVVNVDYGVEFDKIVMHDQRDWKPEGLGPAATPTAPVTGGTVTLGPLRPTGLKRWRALEVPTSKTGHVKAEVSFDGGTTWSAYDRKRFGQDTPTGPLTVRLTLGPDQRGQTPSLTLPEAVFEAPRQAYPVLQHAGTRYTFDAATGAVSGLELTGARPVRMMPPGSRREAFRLKIQPEAKPPVKGHWVGTDAFNLAGFDASPERVRFTWQGRELPITLTMTYTVDDDGTLRCQLEVDNRHEHDVVEAELLRLDMLQVGPDPRDDTLIWPVGTGKRYPRVSMRGQLTMTYPKAAVGYFDLFDHEAGLYVATEDPALLSTVMQVKQDDSMVWLEATMTKRDRVERRGGKKTFEVVLAAHRGDWHAGADLYRTWYRGHFDKADWPDWLEDSDGWQFGNITYDVDHYDELPHNVFREALRMGFRHVQVWGTSYLGGGGQYYMPPPHYGGHEAFARANGWWKERGGIVGYYMFPNGINAWVMWPEHKTYFGVPWQQIPAWGRPPQWDQGKSWDWAVRNASYRWDRTPPKPALKHWAEYRKSNKFKRYHGAPAHHPVVGMCPLAQQWLDWYRHWVVDIYTGRFNTGSSYNDTMHIGGDEPMYNPHLGLHGDGTGGHRRHLWAKRIRDEARRMNPDYLPIMEMQCDAYGMYFAYMIGSSAIDSEMLLYTHPDHLAFEGQTGSGQFGMKRFKRFGSAWCYGSRLDHRHDEAWAVETVHLRNWITRWVNDGQFIDDIGLTTDNPEVRGKLRRIDHEDGSRGILATFWHQRRHDYLPDNPTLKGKTYKPMTVEIDLAEVAGAAARKAAPVDVDDWVPHSAYLVDFGQGGPRKVDFEVIEKAGRQVVRVKVPSRWINGVLLVRRARGVHSVLARADQQDFASLKLHVVNPGSRSVTGSVEAVAESLQLEPTTKSFTVGPGKSTVVSFPYPGGKAPEVTELVRLKLTTDGATREIRTAAYPFMDDASFERLPTTDTRNTYSKTAAHGTFSQQFRRLAFRAEPSTRYRLVMKLRCDATDQRVQLLFNPSRRLANHMVGTQLQFVQPVQLKKATWQEVTLSFETPALFSHGAVYMRGAHEPVLVDDVRLERLPDDAEVDHHPRYVGPLE